VKNLNPEASPGFPLMRVAASNALLLETIGADALVDIVVARLESIEDAPLEAFTEWTAGQLVDAGLVDPVRVFVKNELHSAEKVAEGRHRLIASISVVDQLVERVLNGQQNQAEIVLNEELPSKPGMGLHDEGLDRLARYIGTNFSRPVSSDISGFDWSVPQWLLDLDATVRARLAGVNGDHSMWWRRARLLGLSRFVLSDGSSYDQVQRGLQKSGSYNTSSSNSRMRVMLGWLAGANEAVLLTDLGDSWVMAMGDDAVEEDVYMDSEEVMIKAYKRLGFRLKNPRFTHKADKRVDFCSYLFDLTDGWLSYEAAPANPLKMVATYFYRDSPSVDGRHERWAALCYELRRDRRGTMRAAAACYEAVYGAPPPVVPFGL